MGIIRFGLGFASTAAFTFGLFALPVALATLGGHILSAVDVDVAGEERFVQIYWEPPAGGGSSEDGEVADRNSEPVPEADEEKVAAVPNGTAPQTGGSQRSVSRGSGGGTGGGHGSGSGLVTMYRPEGAPSAPSATVGRRAGPRCEPSTDQITKTGETTWSVERDLIDEYASLKRMQTLVGWVDRHRDDTGDVDGVVLGGIACGSPLHLAGIRSGDVVHDVNGHEVTSIAGALKAYGKLKKAEVLEVNLTRRGRPLHVTYIVS